MNQADVTKLMSKLRFAVRQDYRRLRNPKGPEGRLEKISKTLTALIKYERIELAYQRADESRGYVERVSGKSSEIPCFVFQFSILFSSLASVNFGCNPPRRYAPTDYGNG